MLTDLCTLKFSQGRMLPTYYTNACLFGCMLPFCRWLISVRKSSQLTLGSSRANRHIIQRKVCSVLLSQPVNFLQTLYINLKGAVAYGNYFFPKKFEFVSLCLQAVYQLSGPVCKATWNGCPSYSASYFHFTLCD